MGVFTSYPSPQLGNAERTRLLPRPERDVIHRIPAKGAVGIEDVPLDEEGTPFGLCHAAEFCEIISDAPIKLVVRQFVIRFWDAGLHLMARCGGLRG